jgi:hypothetical protein
MHRQPSMPFAKSLLAMGASAARNGQESTHNSSSSK